MWQNYKILVFCVTCSILSFLFCSTSVLIPVVCVSLTLLYTLYEDIFWRYFCVHVVAIYRWILNCYNFLTNMYHQSHLSNGQVRKYINNNTPRTSIGLFNKCSPNPNHNLISSYTLQNESGLSKSFQSPLKSLRYSIDSSLSESSKRVNNTHSGLYNSSTSSQDLHTRDRKYSSMTTSDSEAGLLTPSTRFNLNLNPKLYADINSPGFCGRVAEKLNESLTHQAKYSRVGDFPLVNLNSNSPKPVLSHRNSRAVSKSAVRMRIAPPDISLSSRDNSMVQHSSIGSDESMKSVLQVLREISRKRIHSQENGEDDDSNKRQRTIELVDVRMDDQPSANQLTQGKRLREDSPTNEEVKRQRRQFSNNEISSSLSSSITIQPPHLRQSQKRKAQGDEDSQAQLLKRDSSTKEKQVQYQLSTTSKQDNAYDANKKMIETKSISSIDKTVPKLVTTKESIIETPILKKNVRQIELIKKTTPTENAIKETEDNQIFGQFPKAISPNETTNEQEHISKICKVKADLPVELNSRLKNFFSVLTTGEDETNTDVTSEKIPPLFNTADKPDTTVAPSNIFNKDLASSAPSTPLNNNDAAKPTGILMNTSPRKKLGKSVTFGEPISVVKVISNPSSNSEVAPSDKSKGTGFQVPVSTNDSAQEKQDAVQNGALNVGSTSTSMLQTTLNFNDGSTANKNITSPGFISSSAPLNDIYKSTPSFTIPSSDPPKLTMSFSSTSAPNDLFKATPPVSNPVTQPSAPQISSNTMSSFVTPNTISQPPAAASTASTTAASASFVFGSASTTTTSSSETPKVTETFKFSPTMVKKDAVPLNIFSSTTNQSGSFPKTSLFGDLAPKNSTNSSPIDSKNLLPSTAEKPFAFGGKSSETNQSKPLLGSVFGVTSNSTTTANKISNPFGNAFSSTNATPPTTTQPSTLPNLFATTVKAPTIDNFSSSSAQQSKNLFSSTNSAQSLNSTNMFNSSKTVTKVAPNNMFGGNTNDQAKTDSFSSAKPISNGFSFTPTPAVPANSNIFGNAFNSPSTQSSTTTASFAFGNTQATPSVTTAPFSFGTPTTTAQSNSMFPTASTVPAPSVFNFGSSSSSNPTSSNTVFGASVNNTPQVNSPFETSSVQPSLGFGAATPSSTVPTPFGVNSTQKPTGFGITPNPSQPNSTFGIASSNTPQTASPFTAPNTGFSVLTNGNATNTATFGSTFGASTTSAPFTFGGPTTNTSGFAFGATTPAATGGFGTPATKPVIFGATPAQPAGANSQPNNVFTFGQTSANPTTASPQLNFQFNAGSNQPSAGGFQFNATPTNPSNAFQIGPAAPATGTMFTLGSSTPRQKAVPRSRRK